MVLTIVFLSVVVLIPAPAQAQDLDRRIAVQPGGRLQVDLDMGQANRSQRVSLEVRSHDADEVWVVADLSGLGASSVKFRLDHDARGVVRLYGRAGGLMSWLFGGPGVHVRVWIPQDFSVDLRCPSGLIRIEELNGEIRARTRDAPIEVRGAEGNVHLRTEAGSVRVTEVVGNVTVRASSGSLELSWVTGNIEARTGQGDISVRHVVGQLDLRADSGEISLREVRGLAEVKTERGAVYASFAGPPAGRLETRRGSVEIVFPARFGAQLEARTRHGTVEVDADVRADGKRGPGYFIGAINGGGDPLHLYTARGTIRVYPR